VGPWSRVVLGAFKNISKSRPDVGENTGIFQRYKGLSNEEVQKVHSCLTIN
jgi:hypothetical protein